MGGHVRAQVERALGREQARQARRLLRCAAARKAAAALHATFGDGIRVYLFGSVLDAGRFRLDSDIDLAVAGLPLDRLYEAWGTAEAAAHVSGLDLVRLEDAPDWLASEVRHRGERLV